MMSGSKLKQADLVDGLPQESVAGAAARHGVLAIAAVDDVNTVIADDTIVVEAAGESDGPRPPWPAEPPSAARRSFRAHAPCWISLRRWHSPVSWFGVLELILKSGT